MEECVNEHGGVLESRVTGRDHPHLGQIARVEVVRRDGAPEIGAKELRAHCVARLSSYKVPVIYEFVGALPHTASGKLLRAEGAGAGLRQG